MFFVGFAHLLERARNIGLFFCGEVLSLGFIFSISPKFAQSKDILYFNATRGDRREVVQNKQSEKEKKGGNSVTA